MIKAILAADRQWGIGKDNKLPWSNNSEDLKWFKQMTENQTVIMGRKTWDSLPIQPLPDRTNYVVSNSLTEDDFDNPCDNRPDYIFEVDEALFRLSNPGLNKTQHWVIGGASTIEFLLPIIDEIWISRIDGIYGCDAFLPKQKIRTWYHETHIAHSTLNIEKWVKRGC